MFSISLHTTTVTLQPIESMLRQKYFRMGATANCIPLLLFFMISYHTVTASVISDTSPSSNESKPDIRKWERDLQVEPRRSALLKFGLKKLATRNDTNDTCDDDSTQREICAAFDGNGRLCRALEGCFYLCGSKSCLSKKEFGGEECGEDCQSQCGDRCACTNRPGCIWDQERGTCKGTHDKENLCRADLFEEAECARGEGQYYLVGGNPCHSLNKTEFCDVEFVVFAANLGSDKAVVGMQEIEYKPVEEGYCDDPFEISENVSFPLTDIKEHIDKELYTTNVVAKKGQCIKEETRCIEYSTPPMRMDGNYELALRMVEGIYQKPNDRRFSISFAGVNIALDWDILRYGKEKFQPLDVFVNFKLAKNGRLITVKGFDPKGLPACRCAPLKFCTGTCGKDNGFIMSAFHIIKQNKATEKEKRDPCCETPLLECEKDAFADTDCKRRPAGTAKTFYSIGGLICTSNSDGANNPENCANIKVIKAINLFGLAVTDSRGITYEKDAGGSEGDPNGVKLGRTAITPITGFGDQKNEPLYTSFVYADVAKLQGGAEACIWYEIELTVDGKYELAVRVADDISEKAEQRKFNVYLGEVPVFPEVDIFFLAGQKSTAVDLTLNFEVTDGARKIRLNNFPTEYKTIKLPEDGKVKLSFCTSHCHNAEDRSFLVASFSVIGFNQGAGTEKGAGGRALRQAETADNCTRHNNNSCYCRWEKTCEYNVVTNECVKRIRECGPPPADQCRHLGKYQENFYAVSGVVCNQAAPTSTSCKAIETMLAVHFDPSTEDHTSVEGITYRNYRHVKYDGAVALWTGVFDRESFPPEDKILYKYQVWGGSVYFLTFHIPTAGDGRYELIIHTGELYHQKDGRQMTFMLNEIAIVKTFQLAHYRLPRDAFNLRVNYKITGGGKQLQMEGYPITDITGKNWTVPLRFCSYPCNLNGESYYWTLGGFAAVKVGALSCQDADEDYCLCKQMENCGYSSERGHCVENSDGCKLITIGPDECRRSGSYIFYAHGGLICPVEMSNGDCTMNSIMLAVNFGKNATKHTDIHDIEFVTDVGIPVDDPAKSIMAEYQEEIISEGVPEQDLNLYQSYIWGKDVKGNATPCVTYQVPTAGDGEYEVSIRTGQTGEFGDKMEFSYKLNGQFIARDFKPFLYAPRPKAMNLNANFRITKNGTKFALRGHPEVNITSEDKKLSFELCHGQCARDSVTSSWQIGAVSIIKFGVPDVKECEGFDENACGCRKLGKCQYDPVTKQCRESTHVCSRIFYVGNECRRGGEHIFYVHKGLICPSVESRGDCTVKKVLIAVNFNGKEHTDINGIPFKNHKDVPYEDPDKSIRFSEDGEKFKTEGVPFADLELYRTYAWSASFEDPVACTTFKVSTDGEGEYELSFKLAEVWHEEAGMRQFLLKFNDQVIVESLDMAGVREVPNGFDLNINFKVFNNGTKLYLEMRGYPASVISSADKTIVLGICPGTKCKGFKEINWQVAAFSVVKFEGDVITDPCTTKKE